MKGLFKHFYISSILLLLGTLWISGCAGFFAPEPRQKSFPLNEAQTRRMLSVNSVLVLPMLIDERVRRSLPQSEAIAYLQQIVDAEATAQLPVSVLISSQATFPAGELEDIFASPAAVAEIGRLNGIDSVLITRLHNIRQRIGSSLAATTSAKVDFSMTLIETQSGKKIWQTSFHFEDQALSENLLRLNDPLLARKGARWLGLEEIWQYGVEKTLRNLAVTRERAFAEGGLGG
jgi:PBP1b-binding outer membrane lipoprotein LpoB